MIDFTPTQKAMLLDSSIAKNWTIQIYDGGTLEGTIPISKMVDGSIRIKEQLCSSDALTIGSCEAASFELRLADIGGLQLKGKRLNVKVSMQGSEYFEFPLGVFNVDEVPRKNNTWFYTLTAYDNMVLFDVDVRKWYNRLTFPITVKQLRDSLCSSVGVQQAAGQTLPLDSLRLTKADLSGSLRGREALRAICELNGCFGHINRQGQLVYIALGGASVITFTEGGDTHYKPGATHEPWATEPYDSVIVYAINDDVGVTYPEIGGMRSLSIGNNFLTYGLTDAQKASVAEAIYNRVSTISYTPHHTTVQGRPWLEVGDPISIVSDGETVTTYILERTITGFQAIEDEYEAKGSNEIDNETSTQKQIDRLKDTANQIKSDYLRADMAEITYATIENLDATNAQITNLIAEDVEIRGELRAARASIEDLDATKAEITDLQATNATVQNLSADLATFHTTYTDNLTALNASIAGLTAEDARINNLVATKASITDLTAATARIGVVEADVADIDTLIFGSATGTTIQTSFANAVIAQLGNAQIKDAMIENVSVDKLLAGNIYTNRIRIYGDSSGKLSIVNDTITVSDGDQVRVQIGKDASDDYNIYVWDENGNLLFDAAGLTHAGISRKIIRDDVVMDNANIAASKLNIDSLFTVINNDNSHTVNGSKIRLDAQSQTLDVAFTALTTTVGTQGSTIASQGTAISTIQGQISSKIWQQDIDTSAAALTQTMNTQYSTINQTIDTLEVSVGSSIANLQQQIDGASAFWTGDEPPTLDNYPANEWITEEELQRHVGNMYYDMNGYSYRFMSNGTIVDRGVILTSGGYAFAHYYWMQIKDSEVSKALQDAAQALLGVEAINNNLSTNYSTTAQMNSAISVSREGILQTVSAAYATKLEVVQTASDTLDSAEDYADDIGTAAAADATSKANAAQAAAESYTDRVLVSYSTTAQMNSAISQTASQINQTITSTRTELITYADGIGTAAAADATAKANAAKDYADDVGDAAAADATSKADAAQAAAITTAAADAQAKANLAENNAKGYTETRLTAYSTTEQMNSAIDQTATSITSTVAATYTTKAEYEAFEVGARNLILNSIDLVGETHYFFTWALASNGVLLTLNNYILIS
ncbi:MAG: hypothetical protein IKP95_12805 [Ruminococcus sp.]|nr:hypothetical protein [Ruminococcus sp.]MBR6103300.1 hypothetical protein [Ruminococcus sp.]